MLSTGCDRGSPGIEATETRQSEVHVVRLGDFDLPVHFVRDRKRSNHPLLVLFATGDGGWTGVDQDIVETIVGLGYPMVGFSARDYLEHLDSLPDMAAPEQVGADYVAIAAEARRAAALPDSTPVVLSGFSRGAALSVIAAGHARLQPSARGVLAIGLGDVEEYVVAGRGQTATPVDLEVMKPYEYLKDLGALPVSVIQSTRDRFLDASQARRLFGPDTDRRHFQAIEAQGHSFGGALATLAIEIEESLSWIESQPFRPAAARPGSSTARAPRRTAPAPR